MRNFKEEIEKAKQETIQENRDAWVREYLRVHKGTMVAPEPPLKEITPKSWFIAQWETGFVVADFQKLMKLPKRSREKILALGGIK